MHIRNRGRYGSERLAIVNGSQISPDCILLPGNKRLDHLRNRFAALLINLFLSCTLNAAEPNLSSHAEWGNTLKKAHEQGQLTVYGTTKYDLLFAEFQKQYPQIKVTVSTTRGSDVISRLMSERRAGRYLVDLHLGSANASYLLYKAKIVDRLKPVLMLAEITDESKWWGAKHRYLDGEREYIFSFDGEAQMLFAYNTNLVNPNDLKSLWDFLDPKWKGKIVGLDHSNRVGCGEETGPAGGLVWPQGFSRRSALELKHRQCRVDG